MSWLKIETGTPMKPEISRIAALCKCSRAEAFLAFFKFFVWAESNTETGKFSFLTPDNADEHAGLKDFGKALAEVKWIVFQESGADIANWDRHNGKGSKNRALDAERKRKQRGES